MIRPPWSPCWSAAVFQCATELTLALVLSFVCARPVHAQAQGETSMWPNDREMTALSFAYSLAVPVGDMNYMLGGIGYRGFDFSVAFPVVSSLYLGASFSTTGFYHESDRETYTIGRSAITGKLYRYASFWTFCAVARYMFMHPRATLRPFVGMRVGAATIDATTYIADLASSDSPAGLLLVPEGGVSIRLSHGLAGYVAYQFNITTASTGRFDMLSYNAFNFGFTFQSF